MQEVYRDIKGYEGKYQVSNYGNVKSLIRNAVIKPDISEKGYKRVTLSNDSKIERYLVHRLVALAFIPNSVNKPDINHIDNNPSNNNVSNLEWCTHSENMIHCHKEGRCSNLIASEAAIPKNYERYAEIYLNRLGDRFLGYYPPTYIKQGDRKKSSGSAVKYICSDCNNIRIGLTQWAEFTKYNGKCPNCQTSVIFLDEDIV